MNKCTMENCPLQHVEGQPINCDLGSQCPNFTAGTQALAVWAAEGTRLMKTLQLSVEDMVNSFRACCAFGTLMDSLWDISKTTTKAEKGPEE